MDNLIYGLCALTDDKKKELLLRSYFGTRFRLLLWSGLCFAGLTANNILLVLDKVVLPEPEIDFSLARSLAALLAMAVLIYGLIFDER